MPPKPRSSQARRVPTTGRDRGPLVWAVGGVALLLVGVVAWLLVGRADDAAAAADARAALEAAGCTLRESKADKGVHSITTRDGTSKSWKTDPPTSGAHYPTPVVYGAYPTEVNQAQLVHNLEHGGIFIQYGRDVPDATLTELRAFYERHTSGTVVAPYPSLGDRVALGAWVSKSASTPDDATAYLATCRTFDQAAFEAFFEAFQFKGPERFPADSMLPGRT
jgi:hypothetical protein